MRAVSPSSTRQWQVELLDDLAIYLAAVTPRAISLLLEQLSNEVSKRRPARKIICSKCEVKKNFPKQLVAQLDVRDPDCCVSRTSASATTRPGASEVTLLEFAT